MALDKEKLLAEQVALLKKHAMALLEDEIVVLAPEIADAVISLMPDSVKAIAVPLEAAGVSKLQDLLKDLIASKLA